MKQTVLKFGAIAGVILSAMMAFSILVIGDNGSLGALIGYTTMILAFSLAYFGVRSYRDTVAKGSISFGRAFAVGMLITAFASCFYVATWEVMYYNFLPDFATKYAAAAVERTKTSRGTPAQIEATKVEMDKFVEMYKNPLIIAGMTFLEPLPVGLLAALICAALLKRKGSEDGSLAAAG